MNSLAKKGVFRSAEMAGSNERRGEPKRRATKILCFQRVTSENPPLALFRQTATPSERGRPARSAVRKGGETPAFRLVALFRQNAAGSTACLSGATIGS